MPDQDERARLRAANERLKFAAGHSDRLVAENARLFRQRDEARAALKEIISQCHNLPRTETADEIVQIAEAGLKDAPHE